MRLASVHTLIIVLAGVIAAPAWAQDSVVFRLNLQPGQRWEMQSSGESKYDGQVGQKPLLTPYAGHEPLGPRKAVWEVLKVHNGAPTMVRVTFDKSCVNPPEQRAFPFVGQTIRVMQLPAERHRRFDHDFAGNADNESLQEMGEFLFAYPSTWYYPPGSVKVGDSWPLERKQVADKFDLRPDDSGRGTCRLASVAVTDGRKVARLAITVWLTIRQHEADGHGPDTTLVRENKAWELKGQGTVDLDTGLMVREDFEGTLTVAGLGVMPGPQGGEANIAGKGTMKLHREHRLMGSMPAGPATLPAAARYAGTFADDRLMVQMKETGGRYAGTIRLGQREFPLTAQESGRELRGTFQSNGHPFEFAASLDGRTLTLTTGRTMYVLHKQ